MKYQKVKTEHTILPEFKKFLLLIEKNEKIKRMIPWRINRQQKSSSDLNFRSTIQTQSGFKCIMAKWSTAQELFVVCDGKNSEEIRKFLDLQFQEFKWK